MKTINYWSWKDSEIVDELKRRGIEVDDSSYARNDAIKLLKIDDQKVAGEGEMLEENDSGKIDEVVMADLKKEVPQLMLTRVIFHNTSDQDLPYVPVGHNGRAFYIPRDVEVDVPDYILNSVIKDAVIERLVQKVVNGEIVYEVKPIQRFPYTIVKPSFPAEG